MFILPWLMLIPLGIADQIVMTLLVHFEYANYRVDWESDGQPHGIFWIPREVVIWRWFVMPSGAHAFRRLTWHWCISTPVWLANDNDARRLLYWHRILFPAFWICLLAPFAVAFISQW